MSLIRLILKIILFPVSILLSILVAFLTFLLSVSSIILGIVSFVCVIAAISAFIQHDMVTGIQGLVIRVFTKSLWTSKAGYISHSIHWSD